jgi:hypothetical protein
MHCNHLAARGLIPVICSDTSRFQDVNTFINPDPVTASSLAIVLPEFAAKTPGENHKRLLERASFLQTDFTIDQRQLGIY